MEPDCYLIFGPKHKAHQLFYNCGLRILKFLSQILLHVLCYFSSLIWELFLFYLSMIIQGYANMAVYVTKIIIFYFGC